MKNRDRPDGGNIPKRLLAFADRVAGESPLYARLCRAISADPGVLAILAEAPYHQPAANLILAAVQYLLLEGADPGLASHYPGLGPARIGGEDPTGLFVEFCQRERDRLIEIVTSRTIQTNEVRRCTALMPAFASVAESPLALLEIGPSAGLNLVFDRYAYDYGESGSVGEPADLTLATQVRGGRVPIPAELPPVVWRCGVDLHPIDVTDLAAVRWGRALLWPEQEERIDRYRAAVAIAQSDPPLLVAGDAIQLLPELIAQAPPDGHLVVFHSFAIYQFSSQDRARVDSLLVEGSRTRPISRISIEMLIPEVAFPEITLTDYRSGSAHSTTLGACHYHGAWLEWAS